MHLLNHSIHQLGFFGQTNPTVSRAFYPIKTLPKPTAQPFPFSSSHSHNHNHTTMKPQFVSLLLLLSIATTWAATCHPDDHQALLGFKSGITHDPTGILRSWKATTHCCKWAGITCTNGSRVEKISLSRFPEKSGRILSGSISPSLSKLQFLTTLDLQTLRNLSGPFPASILRLTRLVDVSLDDNRLSGPIPTSIGNLNRLEILSLSGNRFTGPIPDSISKLTKLTNLRLARNLLTGPIPVGIGKLTMLVELDLTSNHISGPIPNFFNSFKQLRHVYLSNNKLVGPIPDTMTSLPHNFYYLEVANNALSGAIPSFLGKFQDLLKVDLSMNQFSGVIPKSFENMTMLGNLNVSHNNLVGPLPNLSKDKISQIDLSYNRFNLGTVPEWIMNAFSLNTVGLARCGIKMDLGSWKSNSSDNDLNTYFLYTLDISENQITGSPVTLFNSSSFLREFKASGNKLKFNMGRLRIPKILEILDLSRNEVYGNIPRAVARLKSLNVSYNHLSGPIPTTNFLASSFVGNKGLCGAPLPACKA